MLRAIAFFAGLLLGLAHYEVWKITNAALDAREKRFHDAALMALVQAGKIRDESSALVVEMCRAQSGQDCRLRWED